MLANNKRKGKRKDGSEPLAMERKNFDQLAEPFLSRSLSGTCSWSKLSKDERVQQQSIHPSVGRGDGMG